MGDHDAPAIGVGVLGSLDGLGEGTDLVDLEQESVGRLELNGLLNAQRVGDGQVITDNLARGALGLVEVAPGLPVVLGEGVLDRDNGVLLGKVTVHGGELLVGNPLGGVAIGVLEVEVVLLGVLLVELAGGNVHGDADLASVASLLDGVGNELEGLLGSLDIGSDTTLVTNVASRLAVLLLGQSLELVVDLGTLAHGVGERGGLGGDDHELLEGEAAASVGATVEDVHEGDGKDVGLLGASKVGDVSVERDTLLGGTGLGNGERDTEDGVGTELALVGSAIELVEEGINGALVLDVKSLLDDGGGNDVVDVVDGLGDTLAEPLGLVTVTELDSLVLAYRLDCVSRQASLESQANRRGNIPVEAPEGTMARWRPVSVTTSTSTVGLPRES